MTPHMKISEYIRRPDLPVPVEVMDKIYIYHAIPMSEVREELGIAIFVSQRSGYRPEKHEKWKGRSGNSQHVFRTKGAADYVCNDMEGMARLMIQHTDYTRLCYYPNALTPFIHADYKADYLQLFLTAEWSHVSKEEFWGAF